MTVAFDAFTQSAGGTGNQVWTHTPVGTPRAIIVGVFQIGSGTDQVTSVTYGTETMTEVTGSPNLKGTGEAMASYLYFLGSNIPTGNQTVTVTVSGAAVKGGTAISLTGAADTEIVDVDATINSDSQADPSVTLSLGGRTSFASIGFVSGQDAITGITPLTGWTSRSEGDGGLEVVGTYTYDTIGSTDVTAGWTQTADDAVAMAIAVSEVVAPPAPPAVTPSQARGGRRRQPPLVQYLVELGNEKHYFWTQQEAEDFLRQQARKLVRRAKAVARKSHRITLPAGATAIPLPQVSPIPRFVVQGTDAIAILSQRINAKIDAVLANPDFEGDLDDEDLTRILN